MAKQIQIILTITFQLEERNLQEKLLQIQNAIKDIPEISEYGFNIYDVLELPDWAKKHF